LNMTSSLRYSIIAVMALAALALGMIAYNTNQKPAHVTQSAPAPAPLMLNYLVAAHPLPAGTLAREEDFATRSAPSGSVPSEAVVDSQDARIGLRGSLVRRWLDTGTPITAADVLRPRDRGFLASVLEPGTRAISINVDAASGVSGLIWPGDHVDVVLTHEMQNADPAHKNVSETVLQDIRIIAIDQKIVQGAPNNSTSAGELARTVTLQVAPEQVERITVAEGLGKLSLAMRSAGQQQEATAPGTVFGSDVSAALAHQGMTVVVLEGKDKKEYSFKR
jgi:pilus assembly protein CpaB